MKEATEHALWTGPAEDPSRYHVALTDGDVVAVGDGGEGLVYRATRRDDDDDVALKMLTAVPIGEYPEVARSARLLAAVEHPNVMHQLETFCGRALGGPDRDADDDFSVIYSAAEWIDGEPLASALERHGPARALRWVGDTARGLAALHAARSPEAPDGIVHGDVKPSNVRIGADGTAKVIDFGFSHAYDGPSGTTNVGTYRWRAPELIAGRSGPGPASDAWGVGALAHWVLVGEPPRTDADDAVAQIGDAGSEKGFANAAELARHVGTLLVAEPSRRRLDLAAWADELDTLVDRRHRVRWRRRPALVALAAAALGIAAGVGLTLAVQALDDDDGRADRVAAGLPGSQVRLAGRFEVPESTPDQVVMSEDHVVTYRDGRVMLSGSRDGRGEVLVNDDLELQVTHPNGATVPWRHNYGESTDCASDVGTAPQDVTHLFAPGPNIVRVIIRGGCRGGPVGLGGYAGAGTPLWLTFDS